MTVESLDDIDVQLVGARWRWLHSVWAEEGDGANRAQADIDRLLERRYVLMQAAVAGTDRAVAASGAGEDGSRLDVSHRRRSAADDQSGCPAPIPARVGRTNAVAESQSAVGESRDLDPADRPKNSEGPRT